MNNVSAVREHCEMAHRDPECHEPIREAFYGCQVCEEIIICQRNEIEGHIVGAHNISLAEYSGKYHAAVEKSGGGGGRDFSKRKKLKDRKKTPGPKSKTMLVDSDDDEPEPEKEHNVRDRKKSTPGPKSKTEGKAAQPGPKSKKLKGHEPKPSPGKTTEEEKNKPDEPEKVATTENDTSWRDACKFACNYCSEEMSSRHAIVSHCKKEHGKDGTTKHYRMSSRVEHECLLCRRSVLHENKILNDHMHQRHKFNLVTYEERHYFPSVRGQAASGAKSDTAPSESAKVKSKATKMSEKEEEESNVTSVKSTATTKQPSLPEKPESQEPTAAAASVSQKAVKPKKIILGRTASEKPPELQQRPKQTTKRKLEFSSENKENANGGGGAEMKDEASKPKVEALGCR